MTAQLVTTLVPVAVAVAVGWLVPLLAAHAAVAANERRGRVTTNYRGRRVALGLGWAWFAWSAGLVVPTLLHIFAPRWQEARLLIGISGWVEPALLVLAVSLVGLADDLAGGGDVRGFGGHLGALSRGRVTTGALKLIGIGAFALLAAGSLAWERTTYRTMFAHGPVAGASDVAYWLLAAATIALSANLVNLTDLRPGRALKVYAVLVVPALAAVGFRVATPAVPVSVGSIGVLAVLAIGPLLATWRLDVAERGMLGDMGANAAGALAGWLLARTLPLPALAVAAAVLVALNLGSERMSFSAVIEGNRVLRWLDMLGRPAVDRGGG